MIEALLLAAALVWLAAAVVAGLLLYRWTGRRWAQVAMSLFLVWLPFWDVIPGYILYQKAIREVGGVRIYRTVQAEGYLDLSATDCYSCWSRLKESGYRYLEVKRTVRDGALAQIEQGPGYYEYRLLPRSDPGCKAFDSLPNAEKILSNRGLREFCVQSIFRTEPVSQYVLSSGRGNCFFSNCYWSVITYWHRIHERATGQVLAESVQVYFTSWLGRQVGLPAWTFARDKSGRPIRFRREEVIKPSS